jgi:hypothetical protein
MKIRTITYQRVRNLGNYESERLEMVAELEDDDEEAIEVFDELKQLTIDALFGFESRYLARQKKLAPEPTLEETKESDFF